MKTKVLTRRIISILLSVAILLAAAPFATFAAPSAADNYLRSADEGTLNDWEKLFIDPDVQGVELTTENAGGVWTDKSVFAADNIPAELTGATSLENTHPVVADKGDNFLVALSAIASNKEIVGYSTIPTDTVLVLDLSSSMRYNDDSNGSAVDELVSATNKAITDLLALNNNNRVAVVTYSGNNSASFSSNPGATTVVLPLDHYTPASTANGVGRFLESTTYAGANRYQHGTRDWAVSVASGVKNSDNQTVSGRKDTETGTFTQDGIYEAMRVFLGVDKEDTRVGSGVQAGTDRIPIMVLMTDGEPTLANNDYNGNNNRTNLGNSVMYNYDGYNHRDTIAFMTQLTAAFAKKQVSSHYYHGDTLFYTMSYGDQVTTRPEALSVMDPERNSAAINSMWNDFLADRSVTVYRGNPTLTVRNSTAADERLTAADKIYVDEYFPAGSDQEFANAFDSIVKEIIIQSRYYPTYVERDHDHDGYITFTDKIGGYMDVAHIVGLVTGDHYFSGETIARRFPKANDPLGGTASQADAEPVLDADTVASVQKRLHIESEQDARDLLIAAWQHDQLVYYKDSGRFSNYIGWYSDKDGNFLDFWYEGISTAAPAGATHVIKSYGFLGETDAVHGILNTDMLYASVRVSKEINDFDGDNIAGEEMLTWQLPASLIPTITYQVSVEVDSDGNIIDVVDVSLESNNVKPIRLLYEVELNPDIYDWNVTEKINSAYRDSTANKDAGYVVYTNQWNKPQNAADTAALTATNRNAYSHFEPSVSNERYYYTENSIIYTDTNGTEYNGGQNSAPNPDGTYYRAFKVYEKLTNGSFRMHTHYERISKAALQNSVDYLNGNWVVVKDTVHRYLDDYQVGKANPRSGTSAYVNYPSVVHIDSPDTYYAYSTLGNNGRLEIVPATGIKVTKTLTESVEGASDTFNFTISGGNGSGTLVRLNAEGGEASRQSFNFADGFTLKAGETVYIIDLENGEEYRINEVLADTNPYALSSVAVNGQNAAGKTAAITAATGTVQTADFTNSPRGFGNLYITKEIPDIYAVPESLRADEFAVSIFLGTHLAGEDFAAKYGTADLTGTVATDGYLYFGGEHIKLSVNKTLEVLGIPEGTVVTVTEQLSSAQQDYFTASYLTRDHSGAAQDTDTRVVIPANGNSTANIYNHYRPENTDPVVIYIEGTKSFPITEYANDVTFEFEAQGRTPNGDWEELKSATVNYAAADTATDKTFTINDVLYGFAFDQPGEYAYRVIEKAGDPATGITFDSSIHTFTVIVEDIAGKLKAEVIGHHAGSVTQNGSVWTVHPEFHNTYHTAEVHLDIQKEVEDLSGATVKKTSSGFEFSLFKATKNGDVFTADGAALATEITDALGDARFTGVYDSADVGTHYYIVKETNGYENNPAWKYDTTEYYVTVEVTASAGQTNAAITEIKRVTDSSTEDVTIGDALQFKNVYDPENTEVDLDPTGANAVIEVRKQLAGRPLVADEFTFYVTENGKDYSDPNNILATGKNTSNGLVYFDKPLTFSKVGQFKFDIHELAPAAPLGGVTYDTTIYDMVVEVADNNGLLVAEVYFEDSIDNTVTFHNTYKASDKGLTLGGSKQLTGRTLFNAEFRFTLTEVTDISGNTAVANGLTLTAESGHDDDGDGIAAFSFPEITYTAADVGKTYYYLISEENGGEVINGINYSDASFVVEVKVEDNLDGTLNITTRNADGILFENVYTPAAAVVEIGGFKTLEGRDIVADEFSFSITLADSSFTPMGTPETATNDAAGNVRFTKTFDTEGEYNFVIAEIAGSDSRITYDDAEYHLLVKVTDSGKGEYKAETEMWLSQGEGSERIEVPTSTFNFHNVYTPDEPTGNPGGEGPEPTPEPTPDPEEPSEETTEEPEEEPEEEEESEEELPYDDVAETDPAKEPEEQTTAPKTGETTNLWLWLALAFISGFATLVSGLFGKKSRSK